MAKEVIVRIKVEGEKDFNDLKKAVESAGGSIKQLENKTKKTSKSTKDAFRGSQAAADRLSSGVSGVTEQIGMMAKAAKKGGRALKASLISTGVGALIVLLGEVIANWEAITNWITGANKELERQIELNNKTLDNLDFELSLLEEKEKILKLEGKSTKEIRKQKEAVILLQQEENALLLENLKTQLAKEKAQIREVTLWEKIKIAAANAVGGVGAGARQTALSTLGSEEEQTRLNEINQQIQESTLRAQQLKLALLQLNQPDTSSGAGGSVTRGKISGVGGLKGKGAVSPRLQAELDENTAILAARSQLAQDIIRANQLISESEKEEAEKRLRIEQALAEYKIETAFNVLNALSGLAEEGSAFAKSIAVAQAVLSTYQGINKALAETTDFTPTQTLRFVNAAAVGVAGFANVAKILSTDASGRTKPNIGGGGGFGGAQQAPSFNVVGTSGVNQLAQTLGREEQPLRAYVVSTEMSTRQALDRNIEETATIG